MLCELKQMQKIIVTFFILITITNNGYANNEMPAWFICDTKSSCPGFNQLTFQKDNTYKVIASLTPDRKVFSQGTYEVNGNLLIFKTNETTITFEIVVARKTIRSKEVTGMKLIFQSGIDSYFKKDMIFWETAPFMYGVSSSCFDEFGRRSKRKECEYPKENN